LLFLIIHLKGHNNNEERPSVRYFGWWLLLSYISFERAWS
jgi:hypothetical protein